MVYGAYQNPYNTGNDPNWETDNPATLGRYNNYTNTLVTCGIALNLEFQDGTDLGRLPGQQEDTSLANIAVVAHGYFLPPSSGEYTFYIDCDNFGYIWVGEKAINAWSASNWDGYSQIGHGSSPTPNFQFTVGVAVPITYLYLNAGGPGYSRFGFLGPSDYSSDLSTNFYQSEDTDGFMPPLNSMCSPPTDCDKRRFKQFYFGSSYTLRNMLGPINRSYPKEFSPCRAAEACEVDADDLGWRGYDLHFLISQSRWECSIYPTMSGQESTDYNADVSQAYGYQKCEG